MTDRVSPEVRSRTMSAIRSRGNRSTELRLRGMFVRAALSGWRLHASDLPGCPDFVFDDRRLAIFVDGCFWHGCPACRRQPKQPSAYWDAKLSRNLRRDTRNRRMLNRLGWSVLRIWEHELGHGTRVLARVQRALAR